MNENELINFNVIASDPDGDNLSFAVSNAPLNSTFSQVNATNYLFSWPPNFTDAGIYSNLEFYVTDDSITPATVVEKINIVVSNVNRSPVLNIDDVFIDENSNWVLKIVATDFDIDDILTYSAFGFVARADWSNNCFEWTPDYTESGVYPDWKVVVNDGYVSVSDSFSVTVNEINDPPILGALTNWVIGEGQLLQFPLLATDVNDDILVFSISNAPPEAVVTNFSRTNYFYYLPDYYASHAEAWTPTITVTEQNEFGWSDSDSFEITVANVNRAATWLPPNSSYSVKEGEKLEFNIEAADLDTNDFVSVVAGNLPEGSGFSDNELQITGYETFSWQPNYNQARVYSNLIFYLIENSKTVDFKKVTITVTEDNLAPELSGPIEIFGIENQEISFAITGMPHYGYSVGFGITNKPFGGKLQNSKNKIQINNKKQRSKKENKIPNFKIQVSNNILTLSWTPDFLDAGYYTNIIVYAWEDFPGRQSVYGTAEVYAKQLIRLKIPKNDINNDELSVIETEFELPEGAIFDSNTWIISWIPKANQSTESGRKISVTVKDNGEPPQLAEASMTIILNNAVEF